MTGASRKNALVLTGHRRSSVEGAEGVGLERGLCPSPENFVFLISKW